MMFDGSSIEGFVHINESDMYLYPDLVSDFIRRKPVWGWILFLSIMVVVFLIGLLAASITERRAEIASIVNNRKVEINAFESRSDV